MTTVESTPISQIRWHRLLPFGLIFVGLVVYINSLEGQFIFDDEADIRDDPIIRSLWPLAPMFIDARRPLVTLSLAVNYALDEWRPPVYHLFNLAVHVATGLALYGVIRRTMMLPAFRNRFEKTSSWFAFVVTLLWIVHPMATQAVDYVIQRSESMMGMFYCITLYCGLRSVGSKVAPLWYTLATLGCGLGMLTKEVMVTAPVMVLIFDRTFATGSFFASLRQRRGLYVPLAATWGLFLLMGDPTLADQPTVGFNEGLVAPFAYLLTQSEVICHYLLVSLWPNWPHSLVFDYMWPPARSMSAVWPYLVTILLLLAGTGGALWRRSWLGVIGAWFFLILAPTSSFYPIADLAVEHRMYLPLAAVMAVVVIVGWRVLKAVAEEPRRTAIAVLVVVAAAFVMSVGTIRRNAEYRTAASLWQTVTDRRPQNPRAFFSLGIALRQEGRLVAARESLDRAIDLSPNHAGAHNERGGVWLDLGDIGRAQADFEQAVSLLGSSDADELRGTLHYNLGLCMMKQDRLEDAVARFGVAIELREDFANAYTNLGAVLLKQGKPEAAVEMNRKVVELDPDSPSAQVNLGHSLIKAGHYEEGVKKYRRAIELAPQAPGLIVKLGNVLARLGRPAEATEQYRLALDGSHALVRIEALCHWAMLLASHPEEKVRDGDQALLLARRAMAGAMGESPWVMDVLAAAMAETGEFDKAVETAERVVELAQRRQVAPEDLAQMRARLALYRESRPYRQTVLAGKP